MINLSKAGTARLKKGRHATLLGVAAATVLAACGSSNSNASTSGSTTVPAKTNSPVVFHVLLSETGAGAFLGSRGAKSLNAQAAYINAHGGISGHPIKLVMEDNQSTPSVNVSLATSWISQGVPFILNGSLAGVDQAVDALATPNGPFIYDLSPGTYPAAGSMVFSSDISTNSLITADLTYLKSKGLTNIAALTSTDGSGVDGLKQLQSVLAQPDFSSFKLLTSQTFDPTAVSVATQLSVIKSKDPQALVVWTTGAPFGTVVKGMSSLGMGNIVTTTTAGNDPYAELHSLSAFLPKNLYIACGPQNIPLDQLPSGPVKNADKVFSDVITAAGGHPSDAYGLTWDPMQLLAGALQKLGVNANAKQILNYMQNLKNVPGIDGIYNTSVSDHRGLVTSDLYVATWNGTQLTAVSGPGGVPKSGS
ncbi:MAG: hypothetical protein EPN30_07380 [Actinomycetota bacterium]|nr:MAG: hypothetical protein EPN30_07380 [Actinomycetota bacterium]